MLTKAELAEIAERCEKATKGPWRIGKASPNGLQNIGTTEGLMTAQTLDREDAAFIANAREDVPKLLSHIAQQGAEIERLNRALNRIAGKTLSHYVSTDDYKADLPSIRIAREAMRID